MESIYEGLPCRHELCIFIKETKPISLLYVHKRWTNEYFKQNDLPQISDSDEEEEEKEEGEEEEEESSIEEVNEDEIDDFQSSEEENKENKNRTNREVFFIITFIMF